MKLQSLKTLNSAERISSIDIFRSIAILAVVLYHYNNTLPFGYLGVDLFFLISGLLVGGILTKEFAAGNKVQFLRFFLQRGFKIWPSYYAFILFGTLIAIWFYRDTNPEYIIPLWDLKRYLLFYQNYTGEPYHGCFDHVWSLCVEEHFYILLPLLYLFVQRIIPARLQLRWLFIFVVLTIFAGMIFKHLSWHFTNGKDTFSATHNRIDALAWGVLLNLLITYAGDKLRNFSLQVASFATGLILFISAVFISARYNFILFEKLYFHSIVPIAFFLLLMSLYYFDFSKLKPLRFIAYYSYNWYLWHPLFIVLLTGYFGPTFLGLMVYLIVTFAMAMLATILIEEPVLRKRKAVLNFLFRRQK